MSIGSGTRLQHQRVHILGAGSLGLLFAGQARRAGHPVTLHLRDQEALQRFHDHGSVIQVQEQWHATASHLAYPVEGVEVTCPPRPGQPTYRTRASRNELEPLEGLLVVATKACDVVPALAPLVPRLTSDTTVVLLQNGIMAVYQEVWQHLLCPILDPEPAQHEPGDPAPPLSLPSPAARLRRAASIRPQLPRVLVAIMTHGAYTTEPFSVVHAGLGDLTVAAVDPTLPSLQDPAHKAAMRAGVKNPDMMQLVSLPGMRGDACPSHASLMQLAHLKLVVNCAINPLTALLGCLNGQLLDHAPTRSLMRGVCTELHALYAAQLRLSLDELVAEVEQVAKRTAGNQSSMLQDVSQGRQTEVEYLLGAAVRAAAERRREVPRVAALYQLIKAKELLPRL